MPGIFQTLPLYTRGNQLHTTDRSLGRLRSTILHTVKAAYSVGTLLRSHHPFCLYRKTRSAQSHLLKLGQTSRRRRGERAYDHSLCRLLSWPARSPTPPFPGTLIVHAKFLLKIFKLGQQCNSPMMIVSAAGSDHGEKKIVD